MKNFDVSGQVMKKIVRLEETRTRRWMRWFYAMVAVLAILAGIFLWASIATLSDLQAWDLLSIFSQDREIIADFWQDTIMTFIEELPIETIGIAVIVLAGILFIVLATKRRRSIIRFKQAQLANRHLKRNNAYTRKE